MRALLILVALFCLVPACAPGLDGARQAVAGAAEVELAASRALTTFDRVHQDAIAEEGAASGHLPEARAALAAYRQKRASVELALVYAASVTQAAGATIPLVERGLAKQKDLDGWLTALAKAWAACSVALADLGIGGIK